MQLASQFHYESYRESAFGSLRPEHRRICRSIRWCEKFGNSLLADRINNCCLKPMIFRCEETGSIRLYEARCKSRCCPRCARFRASATAHRSRVLISKMDSPRFLTLTIRSSNRPLREQLIYLKSAFAKLRRTKLWKDKVSGGIYTWEVTWSTKRKQWHPHLHAVIDGEYIYQRSLLLEWQRIVDDETGVHIRKVNSITQASKYLASYITKSSNIVYMPDERIAEWASSIAKLRLFQPFGNLHGISLAVIDEDYEPKKMYAWFSPNDLAWDAQGGDSMAYQLLEELKGLKSPSPNSNRSLSHLLQQWRVMRKYEKLPKKKPVMKISTPQPPLFVDST